MHHIAFKFLCVFGRKREKENVLENIEGRIGAENGEWNEDKANVSQDRESSEIVKTLCKEIDRQWERDVEWQR